MHLQEFLLYITEMCLFMFDKKEKVCYNKVGSKKVNYSKGG